MEPLDHAASEEAFVMDSLTMGVLTLCMVLVPDVILVAGFTTVGVGLETFSSVASSSNSNAAGNFAACLVAISFAGLFILDFQAQHVLIQLLLASVLLVLMFGSAVLRGISYPWSPILICLAFSVLGVGFLRRACFWNPAKRRAYYRMAGFSFVICGALVLLTWVGHLHFGNMWNANTTERYAAQCEQIYAIVYDFALNYTEHCASGVNLATHGYSLQVRDGIKVACKKASTVLFVAWAGPLIIALCNFGAGVFCLLHFAASAKEVGGEKAAVVSLLKQFALSMTVTITGMYVAVSASGAMLSLASACMAFAFASTSSIVAWVFLEVDHNMIAELARNTSIGGTSLKVWQSDWTRALLVGGLNVFIPILALLDRMRQSRRRCTGMSAHQGKYTVMGTRVAEEMATWNWVSILTKVVLLGELYFGLVFTMKVSYVLFSWLDDILDGCEFVVLVAFTYTIGLSLFMNPLAPGSAVYLFAGIVVCAQADKPGGIGFFPGLLAASVVSAAAKFSACLGQYFVGYVAGKRVRVQRFLGVDTVPTRALEQILKHPGMGFGKVAILVAGPDFPTSVVCGILKMNIPQMLLGTAPVILVSIVPQCFAGAAQTKQNDDVWSMIGNVVVAFAMFAQCLATFTFSYSIIKTIERDGEKLKAYREEHQAVAQLTEAEESLMEAYRAVSKWDDLSCSQKACQLTSAGCVLLGCFLTAADFVFTEKFMFRSFGIRDKISASVEDNGLDDNPLKLVIWPSGVCIIATIATGAFLQQLLARRLTHLAQKEVRKVHHMTDIMPPIAMDEPQE